ncbi:hypothetical protein HDU67_002627, partial [Dinochytrium kinnereticum]
RSLVDSGARIFVFLGYDRDAVFLLRHARRAGLVGPKFVWIGGDGATPLYVRVFGTETAKDYTNDDRANAEGWIFASSYEIGAEEYQSVKRRYEAIHGGESPRQWSYFWRDCLITMRHGVKRQLDRGFTVDQIISRSTGLSVVDFINTTFMGASGLVSYDQNGDRIGGYQIQNVVNGKLVNSLVIESNFTFTISQPLVFNGGSTVPPLDGVILTHEGITHSSPVGIAFLTLYAIGIIGVVGIVASLIAFRNSVVVKAMSLPFLLITSLGILLEYITVIAWIGQLGDMGGWVCNLQSWAGWIGFSLVMQGTLPKCWRIYRIFENTKMAKMKTLKDEVLIPISVILTLGNVIILAIQSSYDPPLITRVDVLSTGTFHYECLSSSSDRQRIFNIVLMAYNGLLLLLLMGLAYMTRKVSSAYRETTFLFYAAQNIMICALVVIALSYSPSASGSGFLPTLQLRLGLTFVATTFVAAFTIGRVAFASALSDAKVASAAGSRKRSMHQSEDSSSVTSNEKKSFVERAAPKTPGGDSKDVEVITLKPNGHVEFRIPVKESSKTFSLWEMKSIIYITHSKLLLIISTQKKAGETWILNDTVTVGESGFPDCLDIKLGSRLLTLQFSNSSTMDAFRAFITPA